MNRKLVRVLCVIFTILTVISFSTITLSADSGSALAKKFDGTSDLTGDGETLITNVIGTVLSVVRIVAVGIGLIMITYLGIQYMSAAPSEKADIKNKLITFTVGVIVVYGAATLLDIIKNFATNSISG